MFSIVIVTYNSENCIGNCLESMKKYSKNSEVIIIDNSNKDYGLDCVIKNATGSYPSGLNQGIKLINNEYIVCCNPDIIVEENWLNKMKWAMDQGYEVIGPMSDWIAGAQRISLYKTIPSQINVFNVSFFIGFCFMIRKSIYKEIGSFDENFKFGCDDIDYSVRVKQANHFMGIMPHVFVKHTGHQSALTNPNVINLKYESLFYLFKKYQDMNFQVFFGASWSFFLLDEIAKKYPEVINFKSWRMARCML